MRDQGSSDNIALPSRRKFAGSVIAAATISLLPAAAAGGNEKTKGAGAHPEPRPEGLSVAGMRSVPDTRTCCEFTEKSSHRRRNSAPNAFSLRTSTCSRPSDLSRCKMATHQHVHCESTTRSNRQAALQPDQSSGVMQSRVGIMWSHNPRQAFSPRKSLHNDRRTLTVTLVLF